MKIRTVVKLFSDCDCRFIAPTSCCVFDCVASPSDEEKRQTETFDVFDTLSVSFDGEVERPKPVAGERIRPALQHDRPGTVPRDHTLHELGGGGGVSE